MWPVSFKAVQKKVIEYEKEKLRHARQAENQWEYRIAKSTVAEVIN
jgi:hypothetical protein